MPNDQAVLTYCHAWHDTDAADVKDDYRFPHHKTKGGPANLTACSNGLGRLEGSTIPEGDKAGVKAHLQAHLDDGSDGDDGAGNRRPWRSTLNRGGVRNRGPWYRIEAKSDDDAEVMLYDEIGGWWGTTAADFAADLKKVKAKNITLRVNSPGGDVFDGLAIMHSLIQHPATVTARVEGLAASAASFICMGADCVQMARGTMMMIHEAAGFAVGNAADMRQLADLLDKVSGEIADLYAGRAGGTADEWRTAMRAETWYSAREAVEAGLADEVLGGDGAAEGDVAAAFDLSIFAYNGRGSAPDPWIPGRSGGPRRPADRAEPPAEAPVTVDARAIFAALKGALKG